MRVASFDQVTRPSPAECRSSPDGTGQWARAIRGTVDIPPFLVSFAAVADVRNVRRVLYGKVGGLGQRPGDTAHGPADGRRTAREKRGKSSPRPFLVSFVPVARGRPHPRRVRRRPAGGHRRQASRRRRCPGGRPARPARTAGHDRSGGAAVRHPSRKPPRSILRTTAAAVRTLLGRVTGTVVSAAVGAARRMAAVDRWQSAVRQAVGATRARVVRQIRLAVGFARAVATIAAVRGRGLVTAAAVGATVGAGCYLAGPAAGASVSGLAAAIGSLVVVPAWGLMGVVAACPSRRPRPMPTECRPGPGRATPMERENRGKIWAAPFPGFSRNPRRGPRSRADADWTAGRSTHRLLRPPRRWRPTAAPAPSTPHLCRRNSAGC